MHWYDGYLEVNYPWISYGGAFGTMRGLQIFTYTGYGPQILQVGNAANDQPDNWVINVGEMETRAATEPGWRIAGQNFHILSTDLGGMQGTSVGPTWDASDSDCMQCAVWGKLTVNGARNKIEVTSSIGSGVLTTVDDGFANQIKARGYEASPFQAFSATRQGVLAKSILDQPAGVQTSDFIRRGDVNTPYPNDNDLLFGPEDYSSGYAGISNQTQVSIDSTALFGKTYAWPNGAFVLNFYSLYTQNGYGQAFVGTQVPATKAIVYFGAKCSASPSITATVYAGSNNIGSTTGACSTSYATFAVPVDFSTYSGQAFGTAVSSPDNDAEVGYIAVRPFQHDYNGQQPVLSGAAISTAGAGAAVPTGPASSASGDLVTYTGTSGQQQDSGVALSSLTAKAGTSSCPSGQYETGDTASGPSCAQVTYAQISGTPSGQAPSGAAGGDLGGSYPNPTVSKINGGAVPASATVLGSNSSGQPVSSDHDGKRKRGAGEQPYIDGSHGERSYHHARQCDAAEWSELESDAGHPAGVERRPDWRRAVQQLFGHGGMATAQGRE